MGRSRRRNRTSPAAAKAARTAPSPPERRRLLAAYLAGALVLAVVALLGTLTLAGALAPWLVLAVVAAAAAGLHRWSARAFAGMALTDDDRLLRTMASGLLGLAVAFAAIAAVLLSL